MEIVFYDALVMQHYSLESSSLIRERCRSKNEYTMLAPCIHLSVARGSQQHTFRIELCALPYVDATSPAINIAVSIALQDRVGSPEMSICTSYLNMLGDFQIFSLIGVAHVQLVEPQI